MLVKLNIFPFKLFLLLFVAQNTFAQQNHDITFRGMGHEGDVRLVWYPYEWPEGMQGFKIKRRVDKKRKNGKWEELTPLIEPGNTLDKDLSPVETDLGQRKLLENKRRLYMDPESKSKFSTKEITPYSRKSVTCGSLYPRISWKLKNKVIFNI